MFDDDERDDDDEGGKLVVVKIRDAAVDPARLSIAALGRIVYSESVPGEQIQPKTEDLNRQS